MRLITDCRVKTSRTDGRTAGDGVGFAEKSLSVEEDVGRRSEALDSSST